MQPVDLQEARNLQPLLNRALEARSLPQAVAAWREVFVGQLDFQRVTGSVPLKGEGLPATAERIAQQKSLYVVTLALPSPTITAKALREAIKAVGKVLDGESWLLVSNSTQNEWQLVSVTETAGREALRRMVFHRGEPHRTLLQQLSGVYTDLARGVDVRTALDRAYDVKPVTKQFFSTYRSVFEGVEGAIQGFDTDSKVEAVAKEEKERKRLFTQRLFNRLLFVAFIQRKGWLTFNGDGDYLNALWRDHLSQRDPKKNFYLERLATLFFASLNTAHDVNVIEINGNNVIQQLIGKVPYLNGGLFEKSDDDDRAGLLVPDEAIRSILNDLFAQFNFTITESTPWDIVVAVDPEMLGKVFEELVTGRHESGSYYTPKEIVSFMCREALKGFLETATSRESAEAIARFVDKREPHDLRNREAVLDALRRVTVCDPACGSGAYLLGMLQELFELRRRLFEVAKLDDVTAYQRKLEIIATNIYGVDIDRFAVNIARLRLWLSLVVEYEGSKPDPLPNLTFKIEQGDSLTAPDPSANANIGFAALDIRHCQEFKQKYLTAHEQEKKTLQGEIEATKARIGSWTQRNGANGLDWAVEFAEIFGTDDSRGGFDVVLANPPYVRQELITGFKPVFREVYGSLYSGTADLYVYFYYRGLQLLKKRGMLAYISSNKWFRAAYGAGLRSTIAQNDVVRSITDFGDLPVFESAIAYPMIFVAQKMPPSDSSVIRYTRPLTLDPPYPDVREVIDKVGQDLPSSMLNGSDWTLTDSVSAVNYRVMAASSIPLGEYVKGKIYRGVVTGLNAAFVINAARRAELIAADSKSAEIIKPFAAGRDIRRWHTDDTDKWLIVTRIGMDIHRYPAIFAHLSHWQSSLKVRSDQGEHWWELRACAYYESFSKPKIMYPDIAKDARFSLDHGGTYLSNTSYFVPVSDLFLLGVINSDAALTIYKDTGAQIRGGLLSLLQAVFRAYPYTSRGAF